MPVFFLVLIYNYLQISLIKRNFLYSIYIINRQSCDIKRDGGSVDRFNLDMPDEKVHKNLQINLVGEHIFRKQGWLCLMQWKQYQITKKL